jgi:hypothetical protein
MKPKRIASTGCIFCKSTNTSFNSIEHIIPESLGNIEHTLPRGVVCDSCNNYFSRKVESPILNSPEMLDIRRKMLIPSKKGKIPESAKKNEIQFTFPDKRLMARFIGKIGLEVLVKRAIDANIVGWEKEIVENTDLDPIRNFSRYNICKGNWLFEVRILHPVNALFFDGREYYELLNEYELLYTDSNELYIVVSLFGVEFTLNMGGPSVGGYISWLKNNGSISPLYTRKNLI